MRRVLLTLAAVVAALGLVAVPVTLPDAPTLPRAGANHALPEQCSGYFTTGAYTTAAGNLYESRTNICLGISTYTTTSMITDGIVRKQCFRNGQPYGSGTGGCRWDSRVELHGFGGSPQTWYQEEANNWCVTCGGTYVQDSGRVYTPINDFQKPNGGWALKVRSKSEGGQVRFYLADGTTRLVGEQGLYSKEVLVP